jgi:hypothetical protein
MFCVGALSRRRPRCGREAGRERHDDRKFRRISVPWGGPRSTPPPDPFDLKCAYIPQDVPVPIALKVCATERLRQEREGAARSGAVS